MLYIYAVPRDGETQKQSAITAERITLLEVRTVRYIHTVQPAARSGLDLDYPITQIDRGVRRVGITVMAFELRNVFLNVAGWT